MSPVLAQASAFSPDWLPGIDDGWKESGDFQKHFQDLRSFQEIVGGVLFREVYSTKPFDGYIRRVDGQFERFPDSPSFWDGCGVCTLAVLFCVILASNFDGGERYE